MCRIYDLTVPLLCFCRYNFEMDSAVPLLTIFTNYSEWKKKMIASLMRRGLYGVSIGLGEECFSENDWLNECDAAFGTMKLDLSPSLCYLSRSIKDP